MGVISVLPEIDKVTLCKDGSILGRLGKSQSLLFAGTKFDCNDHPDSNLFLNILSFFDVDYILESSSGKTENANDDSFDIHFCTGKEKKYHFLFILNTQKRQDKKLTFYRN